MELPNQPYHGIVENTASVDEIGLKVYFASIAGRKDRARYEWGMAPFTMGDAMDALASRIERSVDSRNLFAIVFPHTTSMFSVSSDTAYKIGVCITDPASTTGFSSEKTLVGCPLEIVVINHELQLPHAGVLGGVYDYDYSNVEVARSNKLYMSENIGPNVIFYGDDLGMKRLLEKYVTGIVYKSTPFIAMKSRECIELYRYGDPLSSECETNIHYFGKAYFNDDSYKLFVIQHDKFSGIHKAQAEKLADEMKLWAKSASVEEYMSTTLQR